MYLPVRDFEKILATTTGEELSAEEIKMVQLVFFLNKKKSNPLFQIIDLCDKLRTENQNSPQKYINMTDLCKALLYESEDEGKLKRISKNIAVMSRVKF